MAILEGTHLTIIQMRKEILKGEYSVEICRIYKYVGSANDQS